MTICSLQYIVTHSTASSYTTSGSYSMIILFPFTFSHKYNKSSTLKYNTQHCDVNLLQEMSTQLKSYILFCWGGCHIPHIPVQLYKSYLIITDIHVLVSSHLDAQLMVMCDLVFSMHMGGKVCTEYFELYSVCASDS